jgi:DNA-binding MarR family transcriptional regulator
MPRPTPSELAEELRDVLSALRRRARLETANDALAHPLLLVLRRLADDGPATTADLARAELITPQTAGSLVAKLEAMGHVTRREDTHDGRCRFVTLTAAGRKAVAACRAERQSWIAQRIAQHLDASEQRTLTTALALLRRIVDGSAAGGTSQTRTVDE